MNRCLAFDESGNRCSAPTVTGSDYCYHHLGRYKQAPLRAIVLSFVMLAIVIIAHFLMPELERIVSCMAVLVALSAGFGVVLTKLNRRIQP